MKEKRKLQVSSLSITMKAFGIMVIVVLVTGCAATTETASAPASNTPASPSETGQATFTPLPSAIPESPTPLASTATLPPPTRTLPPPTDTSAPPPSGSGLIAYVHVQGGNGEIYVMNADGSNPQRLTNWDEWDGFPDWSPDGKQIAYYSYIDEQHWVIKIMDADGGNPRQLTDGASCDGAPHWSPDGTRITYDGGSCSGDNREIFIISVEGGTPVNLSNHPADDMLASWSPDGAQLVFSSDRDGNHELYVMDADGSNVRRLTDDPAEDHAPAWSPDGKQIAFYSDRTGNEEIFVMEADGSNLRNLSNHEAADWFPRWSPDGSRITFSSWRDGNLEIYVMDADGSNVYRLTNSPGDDFNSVWQPGGEEQANTWSRSYPEATGTALDGVTTADGGYLFVGASHYSHYNTDEEDLYMMKTDARGEVLWERTLDGVRFDRGAGILPGMDGGYMILGESRSAGAGGRDIILLAVDEQGEMLWSQMYGGEQDEMAAGFQPSADGYLLVGQTASFGAGGTDVYVIQTDALGNALWAQTYGSELDEEGYDAVALPDGGFLILGALLHAGGDYLAQNPDIYLVRTDGQGNMLWEKALEEPGVQAGFNMLPMSDGNYLITGLRSASGEPADTDPLLIQVDAMGNILWSSAIGETGVFDYAGEVYALSEGGYLVTGLAEPGGKGSIPLIRLDEEGEVMWQQIISQGSGHRAGVAILEALDGGYLIVGNASDGGRGWYTLLIKVDGDGNVQE
ncbi:MAG: PD40 domain-containing protein [Anaerolineales bacterium]|nr:PD40 domain-containing protein [Anaerolineales bacterium]